ncbi:DUF6913 domain-containing protein [Aquimarina algicola]|uniref:DUF6913 domain-containing protein n=1 Tax=Aquimarina algicola TaxID=2589995 RepID=UPI001CF3643F|nr:hypothetical protein [Aquimarina algicola]
MILKGLKKNALKKNVEAQIKKNESSTSGITEFKTLAILIDASQPINIVSLIKLANELGVDSDNLKIMGYKEDQKEIIDDKDASYYNPKNFTVNGSIKGSFLQDFIKKDYDILINFYEKDSLELNYIAAASNAKFKIGSASIDQRINDLVIGVPINDTSLFIFELKKYLKILQFI